jgi:putative resolvase
MSVNILGKEYDIATTPILYLSYNNLTRFGYELIEELITKYSKGKIIVISENDKLEPEEEIVKDIMAIMNVYVSKINGLRKYKKLQEK